MEKVLISWSGGKDSSLALHEAKKTGYDISGILTTVTEDYDRISMHGVRAALLEQQAISLGYLLEKVFIPRNASNEVYESRMQEALERYMNTGVMYIVFGDIFLEDIRQYREDRLSRIGMRGIFPLWKRDASELAHTFLNLGFRAITVCVDSHFFGEGGRNYIGRYYDGSFLSELPPSIDPCGEYGEFHSFVYDGPIFQWPVAFRKGEIVFRDNRFYYCDLVPIQEVVTDAD